MRFERGYLLGMALQSIPEPRKVAQEIQALQFPRSVLWQAFVLFEVLSIAIGVLVSMLYPPGPEVFALIGENPMLVLATKPVLAGMVGAALLVLAVFAIYWVGHLFGGAGRFEQALLTVIWVQFVMLLLQVVMLALTLFSGGMAALMNLVASFTIFWILSHFIAEMHGFRSAGLVFVMILLTILAALVGLAIILAVIGVGTGTAVATGAIGGIGGI